MVSAIAFSVTAAYIVGQVFASLRIDVADKLILPSAIGTGMPCLAAIVLLKLVFGKRDSCKWAYGEIGRHARLRI